MNEYFQQISSGYDALADEYIARIYHELEHKPLDRDWLTRFAAAVGTPGPICDLGCGPGHVARYLAEQGAAVLGEFWRVLRPSGEALLSFHVGDVVRHLDTLWEHQVALGFLFYPRARI